MPNHNDPKAWTPDYAWSLIDQVLLKARLQLIDGEMREKLADAQGRVWVESVKKGNAGYAPREYLLEEQLVAEEWAARQVQAALETWQARGYEPCLAFWHAVNTNLLGPLFESRTRAASAEMELRDRPLNRGGSDAFVRKYTREMIGLQSKWRKKIEIFGREANYTLESKRKAEVEGARRLLLAEAPANPMQGPARRPPKSGTLSPFERQRALNHLRRTSKQSGGRALLQTPRRKAFADS